MSADYRLRTYITDSRLKIIYHSITFIPGIYPTKSKAQQSIGKQLQEDGKRVSIFQILDKSVEVHISFRPEEEYKALIASNDTKKTTEEVQAVFKNLKPVEPDFLIGKWKGADFDTGHPVHQGLLDMNWAGKDFRSANDVDPIMVYDENKKRVWFEKRGHAQVCV